MGTLPVGNAVCDALDPILVPLGFAAGQGRGAADPVEGFGVTFCAGHDEFSERFPWMPQAEEYERGGIECVDIIVYGSPTGVIEDIYIETLTLEETFVQLGLQRGG